MRMDKRSSASTVAHRTAVLAAQLSPVAHHHGRHLVPHTCLHYQPPEHASEPPAFNISAMRKLMDGHDIERRTAIFNLIASSELFHLKEIGGRVFVAPDYNQTMEQQREMTIKRIKFLLSKGVFKGYLTSNDPEVALSRAAVFEVLGNFDHSLGVKVGLQFNLWGGAIRFLGTKRHHEKWLKPTEEYLVQGCFAMSELGHGSNVRGIETVATYDGVTQEFVINTPSESAQKYWIGGAANDATHAVVFSQLQINAKQQGVHAFIVQIRDERGSICPRIRIADCGHKIGLNGVDNGRIWFDNARVPRENLLNSVADVSPDGQYISSILNPEKRFGAFMAPLTGGRVSIAVSSVYKAKLGLAIAIRYALTRRAFSLGSNSLETLLLDYPSYQHRLLPLLAKTYAMSFAANELKEIFLKQKDVDTRFLHMIASGYKAMLTWHNIKTLQECRAACGGQALKSENRIGCLTAEFDAQLTFEGDNNVLMQQVSKVLLLDYMMSQKKKGAVEVPYLEHLLGFAPASLISSESSVLRDADFQICIFHLREQDLLLKLWNEVHCKLNEGASLSEALTTSYQTAGDLGQAFSEKAALEACIRAETTASDDLMKLLLGKLRSLYVLSCIDGNPVFLRNQYLFREQCMAIQQEIVLLCAEVRPHALTLVESFGIPHQLLGPIAFDWIECNAWSYAVK